MLKTQANLHMTPGTTVAAGLDDGLPFQLAYVYATDYTKHKSLNPFKETTFEATALMVENFL